MGRPQRDLLVGEPHCYCVHAQCALGQPLFSKDKEAEAFLAFIEEIRECFDLRIYGIALFEDAYFLIFQHVAHSVESDETLQQRWQTLTGTHKIIPSIRLRDRFCNLTGIMQTIAQRYSRAFHQRHGGRGSIWATRYRSCLLADDSAILAGLAWMAAQEQALITAPLPLKQEASIALTPSPLREVAPGVVVPTDEAPLGTVPPAGDIWPELLDNFLSGLPHDNIEAYGNALTKSWALGRPESLVPSLSRMSRSSGRGRSRQLHELNDDLGLCGIWG